RGAADVPAHRAADEQVRLQPAGAVRPGVGDDPGRAADPGSPRAGVRTGPPASGEAAGPPPRRKNRQVTHEGAVSPHPACPPPHAPDRPAVARRHPAPRDYPKPPADNLASITYSSGQDW